MLTLPDRFSPCPDFLSWRRPEKVLEKKVCTWTENRLENGTLEAFQFLSGIFPVVFLPKPLHKNQEYGIFSRLFVTCFQKVGKITKQVEMTKSPECFKGYRVLKKCEPLQTESEHSGGVQFSSIWDIDFKFARINLDK